MSDRLMSRKRYTGGILYLLAGVALMIFCLYWMHHTWTTKLPDMVLIILAVPLVLIVLGYLVFLLVCVIKDGRKEITSTKEST